MRFSHWPFSLAPVVRANRDPRANRVRLVLRARKASKVSLARKGHKEHKDHLVPKGPKDHKDHLVPKAQDRLADNNRLAGPSLRLPRSSLQVVTLLSETL